MITSTDFVIYSGVAIAAIIFQYYLLRWIFAIARRNRYMKAQTELLAKIAEKHGVEKEIIAGIVNPTEQWENK